MEGIAICVGAENANNETSFHTWSRDARPNMSQKPDSDSRDRSESLNFLALSPAPCSASSKTPVVYSRMCLMIIVWIRDSCSS